MKKIYRFMLLAACATVMAACSDNDEPNRPNPDQPTSTEGVFVLNQGTYGQQIDGSLTFYDYATSTATQRVFRQANGRQLGATPQTAIVYGGKIYIGMYESNTIEIVDRATFKSLKQISLSQDEAQGPRSMTVKDGKVYVSMYTGYVSRLDTLTLSIDKSVKVGPNPENIAIRGDYLYVPNSDGMNYPNYGTTASKIDLRTFTVAKTFEVGLNPSAFVCNGQDLYLLCKGNYGDIASCIYSVDGNDASTEVAKATLMAINGNTLYYINAPYGVPEVEYTKYNTATGNKTPMLVDKGVDSPAAIGVDPTNGNIVITSNSMENGWASYTIDGYANIYSGDGRLKGTFDTGVGPCWVFFNVH